MSQQKSLAVIINDVAILPSPSKRTARRLTADALILGTLLVAIIQSAETALAQETTQTGTGPAPTSIGGGGGGGTTVFTTTYYEQGNLIRAGENVAGLGPDLMGDTINEYSGTLEFTQNDFAIPGNNALPMAVGRHLATGTRQAALAGGLFGDWDLEIPHLHTLSSVVAGQGDWKGLAADGVTYTESRCSQFQVPGPAGGGTGSSLVAIFSMQWWDGYHLYAPGSGDQTLVGRGTAPYVLDTEQPSDGNTYPVLTKGHWQLSCLTSLANGTGEGFKARAPDGTIYQFDHMATRPYENYEAINAAGTTVTSTSRDEVWILPSQVTDRFGNWVKYTYDTSDGWKVLSMSASDGRAITFTYVSGTHHIQTATDGTRTWTYSYSSTGTLQTVTQPDASTWQFSLQALEHDDFSNRDPSCFPSELNILDANTYTGTIVHPSGATGSFSLKDTWHGRSNVPGSSAGCYAGSTNYVSTYFANYSLVSKTLSGPGMSSMTWTYNYGTPSGSWAPCNGCVGTETVTITDPLNNVTQNIYGTQFQVNDGLLLTSNEGWNGSTALRSTTMSYALPTAGPYPSSVGYDTPVSDGAATIYTPLKQRIYTQQGETFTQTVTAFDAYARPTALTRSSSLGFTKTDVTAYYDNTSLWILGQSASETVAGIVASSTTFNTTTALPTAIYKFGKLQATYTFNTDGTLASAADGLSQTTTYSNYMRGLAQKIGYADGSSMSAVVNNIGAITSVTNEAGTTWQYGYDSMGRIASATAPTGDPVSYNVKNFSFVNVASAEYGIPANHWRQTITQGNAVTINYFDA
jgi:YD repeat-containing protein